jgi:hypothetical protein
VRLLSSTLSQLPNSVTASTSAGLNPARTDCPGNPGAILSEPLPANRTRFLCRGGTFDDGAMTVCQQCAAGTSADQPGSDGVRAVRLRHVRQDRRLGRVHAVLSGHVCRWHDGNRVHAVRYWQRSTVAWLGNVHSVQAWNERTDEGHQHVCPTNAVPHAISNTDNDDCSSNVRDVRDRHFVNR